MIYYQRTDKKPKQNTFKIKIPRMGAQFSFVHFTITFVTCLKLNRLESFAPPHPVELHLKQEYDRRVPGYPTPSIPIRKVIFKSPNFEKTRAPNTAGDRDNHGDDDV
ncbi:hypothetical protein QE152_g31856 [Popillia japonica]|uniref:Uncharacterized protein n=1 Tax=Popillia japonica TaxID=7064 RepID=A0AAW1J141_POPJA